MSSMQRIIGRQVLDLRGNPTVEVDVQLQCGAMELGPRVGSAISSLLHSSYLFRQPHKELPRPKVKGHFVCHKRSNIFLNLYDVNFVKTRLQKFNKFF